MARRRAFASFAPTRLVAPRLGASHSLLLAVLSLLVSCEAGPNRSSASSEGQAAPVTAGSTPAPEPGRVVDLPEVPTPLLVGNQLRNPGFEDGLEGWGDMGKNNRWLASTVVEAPVHSGSKATRVQVSWKPGDREQAVKVYGASQEISLPRFPDRIGGYYRVEEWDNPSKQTQLYLQAAVIVDGDPRTRSLVTPDDPDKYPGLTNFQLRYLLAGLTEPPFEITNGRFEMVRRGPPPLREWVPFEFPVKADFEELWGVVPANFDFIRVYFEARWDGKEEGVPVRADVYYDDLFFGFDDLD